MLQADLRGPRPLSLAELLRSDQDEFLKNHDQGGAQQRYLYSWGLAYYLLFHRPPSGESIEQFAQRNQGDPIRSFEAYTGAELVDFQAEWRAAILNMKPGR